MNKGEQNDRFKETVSTTESSSVEKVVGRDPVVLMRRNPLRVLWRSLLYVCRIPESLLGKLYRKSPIRKLLYCMEWYRDLADQSEVNRLLQETYGGAAPLLMRVPQFIRKNFLFTFVALVGIYFGGIYALPLALNHPKTLKLIGKQDVDTDRRIEQIKHTRSLSKKIIARRTKLRMELGHCAIDVETRQKMLSLLDGQARFRDDGGDRSMAVIRRFVEHVAKNDIESAIAIAAQRSTIVSAVIEKELSQVRYRLTTLRSKELATRLRVAAMEQELKAVTARADVQSVNRSIRLRDEIESAEAEHNIGPEVTDVDQVLESLEHLQSQIQGHESAAIVVERNPIYRDWLKIVSNGTEGEAIDAIKSVVSQGLLPERDPFQQASRPGISQALFELSQVLIQLSMALNETKDVARRIVAKLEKRRDAVNSQISRFFEEPGRVWVDHTLCGTSAVIADDALKD